MNLFILKKEKYHYIDVGEKKIAKGIWRILPSFLLIYKLKYSEPII